MSTRVFSIAPFEYLHVLNKNDNTKRLICGPKNFALEDHEEIVSNIPEKMIVIPNLHYVEVKDPIEKDKEGNIVRDRFGLAKYRWNIIEVRTREKFSEPFALYPEEKLNKSLNNTKTRIASLVVTFAFAFHLSVVYYEINHLTVTNLTPSE